MLSIWKKRTKIGDCVYVHTTKSNLLIEGTLVSQNFDQGYVGIQTPGGVDEFPLEDCNYIQVLMKKKSSEKKKCKVALKASKDAMSNIFQKYSVNDAVFVSIHGDQCT